MDMVGDSSRGGDEFYVVMLVMNMVGDGSRDWC